MVQQRQYRNATGFIGPTTSKPNIIVPSSYGQSAYSFGGGKRSPQTGSGQDPFWLQALDFVSRPQRAITGTFAESVREGSTLGSTVDAYFKGLLGKEQRDFDEFMTNLGWEDEEGFGLHDVVSFLGNTIYDPVTYTTFGAGSAIKAGARAGAQALKSSAKDAGVKISRGGMKDFSGRGTRELYNATRDNLIRQGVEPATATRIASETFEAAKTNVRNASAGARGYAQNNLFNVDIPFTNIAAGIGRKPQFLQKVEPRIGTVGAVTASDILQSMGATSRTEQSNILNQLFGVRNAEDLNMQQLDFLQQQKQRFDDFVRQGNVSEQPNIMREGVENLFSGPIPSAARNVADDVPLGDLSPMLRPGALPSGSSVPRIDLGTSFTAGSSARRAEPRNVVDAELVENTLSNFKFDEFVQDMGGRSRFGDMLGKVTDYFNPRTLRIAGEGLLNRAASRIRDTHARISGQAQKMNRELQEIEKMAKGLSDDQLRAIPYIIEGKFPESGFRPEDVTDQMRQVADRMSKIYDDIAKLEVDAGVLENVRANYFPHIVKFTDEELAEKAAKYAQDREFSQYINLNSDSQFSKRRERFQTIAQVDNYIASMQRSLANPDLDDLTRMELEEKISILSHMFERNPIDALTKRYFVSIRSRMMQELGDQLASDGLIRTAADFANSPSAARIAGQYRKLNQSQARRLGLSEDDYVHKDVLKALERMETIFSEEGIAKFIGHFESIHNIFKTTVTSIVPRHYLNNAVGNVFNNYLAGVRSMRSYTQAADIILAARRGKLTKAQEDILQEAAERGVLTSGFTSDFTRAGLPNEGSRLAQAEKAIRDWGYTQWMRRNLGNSVDYTTRLAHYIDIKRKTGSATKAAESVRKYLFNYNEMTTMDRAVRLFVPFWNWTKNNVPLQIEQLMQQPRFYQTYERLRDELNEDVQDQIPEWAQDEYVHVGGGQLRNPYLPTTDLNDGVLGLFTNSLTPFAKAPLELRANRNFFTGRPIEYGVDTYAGEPYSPDVLGRYLMNTFGGGLARRAGDVVSGNSGILETLGNLILGTPVNVNE